MIQGNIFKIEKKIDLVSCVLQILHAFCKNQLGKSGSDQKFGEINPLRQRVFNPSS